jgi:hypothetical protein
MKIELYFFQSMAQQRLQDLFDRFPQYYIPTTESDIRNACMKVQLICPQFTSIDIVNDSIEKLMEDHQKIYNTLHKDLQEAFQKGSKYVEEHHTEENPMGVIPYIDTIGNIVNNASFIFRRPE